MRLSTIVLKGFLTVTPLLLPASHQFTGQPTPFLKKRPTPTFSPEEQERRFKDAFDTDLHVKGYRTGSHEDLRLDRAKMRVRKNDSIYIDENLTAQEKNSIILHEYIHIKQNEVIRKLKQEKLYEKRYDDQEDIYAVFILEGSAEAGKHIATNSHIKKEPDYTSLCRAREAGWQYHDDPRQFYATGAAMVRPLIEKLGIEQALTGLLTTPPPNMSDFYTEERRRDYLKRAEDNARNHFAKE